jgi:hypothetical protein
VGQDSEVYVGLDTSKLKISVAIAEAGRDGEVRFFGDIDSTPEAVGDCQIFRVWAGSLIRPELW